MEIISIISRQIEKLNPKVNSPFGDMEEYHSRRSMWGEYQPLPYFISFDWRIQVHVGQKTDQNIKHCWPNFSPPQPTVLSTYFSKPIERLWFQWKGITGNEMLTSACCMQDLWFSCMAHNSFNGGRPQMALHVLLFIIRKLVRSERGVTEDEALSSGRSN